MDSRGERLRDFTGGVQLDQDFHYYGTFYAARLAGHGTTDATLIAKCSNFIDFLSNEGYGGYWRLVRESTRRASRDLYTVVGDVNSPRYTFQGTLSTGAAPEDGMWCSYHFTPGNYPDPMGIPTPTQVHGRAVAARLPKRLRNNAGQHHEVRATPGVTDVKLAKLLNRPMSALSRAMIADTTLCMTDPARLRAILQRAVGAGELLPDNEAAAKDILARFRLALLGARAHVLADTWAHQDWSGVSHSMNTYWDVTGWNVGRQSIEYQDIGDTWKNVVLNSQQQFWNQNLAASPSVATIGHGWMGHLPDFSFIKYRYKPAWQRKADQPLVRNNPEQYRHAFLELTSLFCRAEGRFFDPVADKYWLDQAQQAIESPCEIADRNACPRAHSAEAWMKHMRGLSNPETIINAKLEPDPNALLDGKVEDTNGRTRYGTYIIHATSDLYLFQIAADYHFHFVRNFLHRHEIKEFTGSWSQQNGALSATISDLF